MSAFFLYVAGGIAWWCVSGYFLWLFVCFMCAKKRTVQTLPCPGFVEIIVPVYNEEERITAKIENLKTVVTPNCTVVFVDASTDASFSIIESYRAGMGDWHLMRAQCAHRALQINKALSVSSADIIIISDVDALLPADSIPKLISHFSDASVGCVAGLVMPQTSYALETAFWQVQNSARVFESACGHCPVASGALYAFRRSLVRKIPHDVWADDIYVPFVVNNQGYRVVMAQDIIVIETRAAHNFFGLLRDKIRKGKDNLKEIVRFARGGRVHQSWRIIYWTRFLQGFVCPWCGIVFGIGMMFQMWQDIAVWAFVFIVSMGMQKYCVRRLWPQIQPLSGIAAGSVAGVTAVSLLGALISSAVSKKQKRTATPLHANFQNRCH